MAYITKTEVKNYLGINWSAGLDTFIDTLIAAATKFVENHCGDERFGKRVFEAPDPDNDVTKYFDGNGEKRLHIGDLREITSLTVDGTALTLNTDFYVLPHNYEDEEKPIESLELVQPETSFGNTTPRAVSAVPYIFEELQRSVTVVGKWGYSASPPEDVKLAVIKLVGGIIKENIGDSDLKEVTQETIAEYSFSYAKIKDIAHALGVDAMLTPYKRKKRLPTGTVIKVR